ncbi:hypothetical protein HanRHA438_Chr14g0658071 [Helianthus annuus]|uniref:Uncharacterized protein n=1 Tax=Helianthus annuus TaxID=4232 RepID=A0A9K3E9F0_HELAN|nr:hypothetical protein HanXRQr2_Chr14g0647461 [Helianthus annuus]KAJ0464411.1 hypothetical protein HanHA300_Chr14g0526861 [Helianthus annuus]KAJ0468926.1 hypothetical protein HanIR_Chr14g0702211 [Helianthus annuus]KAJ0485987.1 hypothetical protein HanHA89_Chr14g0574581 [Helianthus annuus]KAJ0656542.1 hypothetical protein HanLR1_Chr14g0536991 [Helianthus annuus]
MAAEYESLTSPNPTHFAIYMPPQPSSPNMVLQSLLSSHFRRSSISLAAVRISHHS